MQELVERDGVHATKDVDDDMKQIMKANFAQIAEKYPENTFQRVFWNQHSQAASTKNVRGVATNENPTVQQLTPRHCGLSTHHASTFQRETQEVTSQTKKTKIWMNH